MSVSDTDEATPISIFGRERVIIDGIAKTVYQRVGTEFPHSELEDVRRGAAFAVQHVVDGDEFVARITIELVARPRYTQEEAP